MTDTDNLTTALAKVQADLPPVTRDSDGQARGGTYKYADLATITPKLLPKLAENGLAWVCKPTYDKRGNYVLRYKLRHVSGEVEKGDYALPDPASTKPQDMGSAISYGRRYCLLAVTGLSPAEDDDDGAAAQAAHATAAPGRRTTRNGSAAQPQPEPEPTPEPESTFQPNETAVALIGKILRVDDPLNLPPEGVNVPTWCWQLAGETDESLDDVPWGKLAQLAGEKQSDLLEHCRQFAEKEGLEKPGSLAQVKGPVAKELQMHLLGALEPF